MPTLTQHFLKGHRVLKVSLPQAETAGGSCPEGVTAKTATFNYRVGHCTVCCVVREVVAAIWQVLVPHFMPAPSMEDWLLVADGFRERWNFHVITQAPDNSDSLYFNYTSTYSIVLLAVGDANYLFRVVDVGGYGKTSNGGSLCNSTFGEELRDSTLDLPEDAAIRVRAVWTDAVRLRWR
ncbi:hypothetical protein ACEWY4_016794 [Coilia grayii]|uniref:DDE Tnp4 domain-containing protein n=1 Tax=Coilia grayii TaxID=363190 RepID=A0ABD1JP52_9TELE